LLLNRRAGVIDDKEWSAFTGLLSHMEQYSEDGDMLQWVASEASRWSGWEEEDEILKETYCRVCVESQVADLALTLLRLS
jgi:hypothetical protein